jgi:hypothetical protein
VIFSPKELKTTETGERTMPNTQQVEVEVHSPNRPQYVKPIKPVIKMYPTTEETREPSMNPLYEYQNNQSKSNIQV